MPKPFNRRDFLKSSGAMVAGSMAAGTLGLSTNAHGSDEDASVYDVIVVGSGFAGVTAARNASQANLRVLHLEASARLGGRTFTSHFAGHDIDLGGSYIGWGQPHVWAEKMRYQVAIDETAGARATHYVWHNESGERQEGSPDDFWSLMGPAIDRFYAPAQEVLPRPYDPLFMHDNHGLDMMSSEEAVNALGLPLDQRTLIQTFAAMNGHSDADQSSYLDQLRWFALSGFNQDFMWDNIGRYKIKGGTQTLLRKIHEDSRAEFKTGQPVRKVEQVDDRVSVTTARGETFIAKKLILSVPLNVVSGIEFSPSISSIKMDTSQQRHTGSGIKTYIRIKGNHPVMFGQGNQDMPFTFIWTEYEDENSQILVAYGISPEQLDTTDAEAIQSAVNQYFPDTEIIDFASYNWNVDPYALGTWCMYRPGWLTERLEELQRPEGNIHFATSDIASGWRGFIDGAIESGAQAAEQVSVLLKAEADS
ncbi:Pseudooxynicotine oxidase [Vreelandella titanicae]